MYVLKIPNLNELAMDASITQPIEIHLHDDGATAVYDGASDVNYDSLADLLREHTVGPHNLVNHLVSADEVDMLAELAHALLTQEKRVEPVEPAVPAYLQWYAEHLANLGGNQVAAGALRGAFEQWRAAVDLGDE